MALGALYVGGLSFGFATCNLTPKGMVPDYLLEQQEELTDTGVDGRRWRLVNRQFKPFKMETLADSNTYAGGVLLQRQYLGVTGQVAQQLTISLGGVIYNWKNVKVVDVSVDVMAGGLAGTGATSGSSVVVQAIWSLVLADTTRQGTT